ncbi:amidohydrolase family protein [Kitasatospora kifunensis]|uniref:Putative TIM-barrel fold metal-dependent hydrolase n=1 Tax=Kitasatospora kifunensis TaxID=58351 RepID=A0A7W7R760_KITKI|nr:amidohydrolase family protein [Kitasatospora kifunensis]MBB4926509.1 putative TIM-barrel fold metal-dependent hydrolase [Kitasatospora kifunensis]
MTSPARIDVHHHVIPPAYRRLLADRGLDAGGWALPDWDKGSTLAMMDTQGIATGVVSVSAPGVHLGDDREARTLARSVNEYVAELVKDHPDRFGQFASIPLPDVEGSIAEAAYALDELHADGVVLMSNAEGRYLGDPAFEPLWAELDARAAVVFIHPTETAMPMLPGIPAPVIDFTFDTTRTAVQMTLNGVMSRHTRMKVILSHAGGFLPYAAHRVAIAAQMIKPDLTTDGVLNDLRRFYFDTALSASPTALPSLQAFAAPGHILYGSDWPFATIPVGSYFNTHLDGYQNWQPGQLHAVNRGNAEALFPRLARA